MSVGTIAEANLGTIRDDSDIAYSLLETDSMVVDNDTEAVGLIPERVPSFPALTENDAMPLGGIVATTQLAMSSMARFLNYDGAVEGLLHKEGPLTERAFEQKWALRELLRGEGQLGYRAIADGSEQTFQATNEKTVTAFRLLAQGALGYPFLLSK